MFTTVILDSNSPLLYICKGATSSVYVAILVQNNFYDARTKPVPLSSSFNEGFMNLPIWPPTISARTQLLKFQSKVML